MFKGNNCPLAENINFWFSRAGETILIDWGTPLLYKKNFPLDGKARQEKPSSQLLWCLTLNGTPAGVQIDKKNFS